MQPAPVKEGKILADLHAHPGNRYGRDKVIQMLSSPGLIGLTHINDETRILSYETAITLSGVKEIDKGRLAEINVGGKKGYFMRTQEVIAGFAHLLALGFEGEYLPNYDDPRQAVEEIHQRNGLTVLNHPFVAPNAGARVVKYRFINRPEKETIMELCEMVDEIEVFNAQMINPTNGFIIPKIRANSWAGELARGKRCRGMASSDAHFCLEQAKICGIYLDLEGLCLDKIKEDIKKGSFEKYGDAKEGPYVSRWSFICGMFGKGDILGGEMSY